MFIFAPYNLCKIAPSSHIPECEIPLPVGRGRFADYTAMACVSQVIQVKTVWSILKTILPMHFFSAHPIIHGPSGEGEIDMIRNHANEHLWSIILAGGEGERARPFIEQWLGYPLPKQFCKFVGTRSMLQHTLDRADCLSRPNQKVTVINRTHRHLAWAHFEDPLAGQVILQPQNCNTAAGVFLPLTYVLAKDPQATVVVYPSDHFVFPENRFVGSVQEAIKAAEILSDRLIILGVRPTCLELEYGWIEKGSVLGWSKGIPIYGVQSFIEKPDAIQGLKVMASDALWNTLVIVTKAARLWDLGWNVFPALMDRFAQLRQAIGTARESQILQAIYQDMPSHNISSDLLHRIPECVAVIELERVLWSDWGRPERIVETLELVGKTPAFSIKQLSY